MVLSLWAFMVATTLITAGVALAEGRRGYHYTPSCGSRDYLHFVVLWALMLFLPSASKPLEKPAEQPAAQREREPL
jgi:hypothetical protein